MLNCWSATKLASDSLDRKLTLVERMRLGTHLAMCPACRRFSRQAADLRQLSRHYCSVPDDLSRPSETDSER
ncbi:zf-HC2 domain-containing protein [Rhizobium sp. C4]|uniref:anti-sigma factor family protein n=1 Tax=Rhizobium sp. C4 TaxID=1349800 RepID=UPI001E635C6E|nr:zf-HC2 domain-containing protein [Rhizobium sp. C4]MCD2174932.1 zf-HC2 domain-containing protein [Rhizobium sp. C4]